RRHTRFSRDWSSDVCSSDRCIVVHLSRGSMWNRHDFPEAAVIEVRPKEPIQSDGLLGGVVSTFDFNAERVEQLMEQGYRDAQRVIGNSLQRSEEHTSELQSRENLVCRLLLEKKKKNKRSPSRYD